MHTEPDTGVKHARPRHLAEKFEGLVGVVMVAAIIILAVGLVYGVLTTGSTTPSWMR